GRQVSWRSRGVKFIGSASEADKSLSLQRRGHWAPMWGVSPKEGAYLAFDAPREPFWGILGASPSPWGPRLIKLGPGSNRRAPGGERRSRRAPQGLQLRRDLLQAAGAGDGG